MVPMGLGLKEICRRHHNCRRTGGADPRTAPPSAPTSALTH